MNILFYVASLVAVAATLLVITRTNAVHALLYMIVSLFAVSLVFFAMGAPFVAALEVIVYAGAIMVLFIFITMMLNLGRKSDEQESLWLQPGMWRGPALLSGLLLAFLVHAFIRQGSPSLPPQAGMVGPDQVGASLFGPYLIGVELAAMLLLAGLVGAYHVGRRDEKEPL